MLLQQSLCSPALNELSDAAPDAGHHREKLLVGLPNLPAEELHDAKELSAVVYWKSDCRVQPILGSNRRPWEVGILSHVGNPGRTTAGPNANRQPNPR
jgi:hypothetical protein